MPEREPWPEHWSKLNKDQDLSKLRMPNRVCKEAIWNDLIVNHCDIAVDALGMSHAGPCASMNNKASIQRRLAWEKADEQRKAEEDA